MSNDNIDPRDRLLSIAIDDDDPPAEPSEPDDDGHELTIGLKATKQDGEDFEMKYSFDGADNDEFFLTTFNREEEFHGTLPWLFILSLAGAKTFSDPINRNLFIQPEPNWIQLYFEQLPQAASDSVFGPLLWSVYSSLEVWLTDSNGDELRRLKMVPPQTASV